VNHEPGPERPRSCRPFLKWAGGKSRLLEQYRPHFPVAFERYHEPFVGGAAVFFWLAPERATLADSNGALIDCYTVVRDHVEPLIRHLDSLEARHSQSRYYSCRDRFNSGKADGIEQAALFIYLNRTCYNGLYRVNGGGRFNVPAGRYARPRISDPAGLRAASAALARAHLVTRGFEACVEDVKAGDLVYIDPPYNRLSASSFTSYTAGRFGEAEQRALARVVGDLDRSGCRVILSNSETPLVRDLYGAFRIVPIRAARAINSAAGGRGPGAEVLILNY
jgi:DNA adenine methylase